MGGGMAKHSHTILAEHFGCDSETVLDHLYQPGQFTKRVFDINDVLWCTGAKPAQPVYDGRMEKLSWEKVVSAYDKKAVLWKQVKP